MPGQETAAQVDGPAEAPGPQQLDGPRRAGAAPAVHHHLAVAPGRELLQAALELAREALRLAKHKLPVKCKFVMRPDYTPAESR